MFKHFPFYAIYICVRLILKVVCSIVFCLAEFAAQAAHTQATLILGAETARPGDTVLAGIRLQMDPHWHTYWKNSGLSGDPTKIEWQLPPGVTVGEIQWPVPKKLPDPEWTTYIYEDEVVLLAPLKLGTELKPGLVKLKARVDWLECEINCVPGGSEIEADLKISSETKPSKNAALLAAWQKKLPQKAEGLSARAWWDNVSQGDKRAVILEWNSAKAASEADFFPYASEQFEVNPLTERLPSDAGKIRLRTQVTSKKGEWPKQLSGVLIQQSGNERLAFEGEIPVETTTTAAHSNPGSLWLMLLYAFLGGLILNIMPCVLPVIALKILGFVGQARERPAQVRKLGLIYALGVLVSFLVLAGLVIGIKAAGHLASWGIQFSSPKFLVVLTVLVTLVALNLFGLFEVNLSGQVMGTAGTLASKHGAAGAFFNGVLATILATPCTAPFLGVALGFAFAQSTPIILLFFATIAAGLALPYVLLSWQPAWLKFLPKPGAWMEKFKIAMGFPMLATAFWLLSLIPNHYGERSWWLGIFLVFVALAAWIFGEFFQRGRSHKGLALGIVCALLIAGYFTSVEQGLQWRMPGAMANAGTLNNDPNGVPWVAWSPEAVAKARAEARPVLVDFTAKWCFTCNAVVKPVLEKSAVRKKLESINAVALLADYTRFPDNITTELNKFKRAGVPMVLVYPKDPNLPPEVFDVVTPDTILAALERAGKGPATPVTAQRQ
jgi:thiol:disulfide interchange protein DsbD